MEYYSFDKEIECRHINIIGEIDESLLTKVSTQINFLIKKKEPFNVSLCTDGGCTYCALAIMDKLAECKNKIDIYCFGKVFSAGTIVLLGGNGISYPNTSFMTHEGFYSLESNYSNFQKTAKEYKQLEERVLELYSKKTKIGNVAKVKRLLSNDHYFNPQKALEYGFIQKCL